VAPRRLLALLVVAAAATGCYVPNPEAPTPCYAEVRGTLWPPSGDPLFVVSARRVVLGRGGEIVAETDTDRRGHFELRTEKDGRYEVVFSSNAHRAEAAVTLKVCTPTQKVDLFVKPP
jgi:hypothetical protein